MKERSWWRGEETFFFFFNITAPPNIHVALPLNRWFFWSLWDWRCNHLLIPSSLFYKSLFLFIRFSCFLTDLIFFLSFFFFFWHVYTRGRREFKLVTSASLGIVPADWATSWRHRSYLFVLQIMHYKRPFSAAYFFCHLFLTQHSNYLLKNI